MGTVTKSGQNNITSPAGNSLAVFVDGKTNILKLKDIEGNIEPLSNYITGGGGGATNLGYTASPTNGIVTSDAEVATLHTIIDTFETALGRKTW